MFPLNFSFQQGNQVITTKHLINSTSLFSGQTFAPCDVLMKSVVCLSYSFILQVNVVCCTVYLAIPQTIGKPYFPTKGTHLKIGEMLVVKVNKIKLVFLLHFQASVVNNNNSFSYVKSLHKKGESIQNCVALFLLDGVGPVYNRPSTDQLHRFVHKIK